MTTRNVAPPDTSATGREIRQQPALWRTVAASVERDRASLDAFLGPLLAQPSARIVLTGAGTSAFAGGLVASGLTRLLRRRVDAVATTDIVADPYGSFAEDVPTVLVSLARSGDSPESVAAAAIADDVLTTVRHLVVTCNGGGALATGHGARADSNVLLMPSAANDTGFAMTSSFTCMVLAAYLAFGGDATPVRSLADAAQRLLDDGTDRLSAVAERGYRRVVFLGSHELTPLAREGALKVLELTAGEVGAVGESSLGFRHGPKAILTPDTLVVVFVSGNALTRRYDEDIATEIRATLGAENVIEVGARDDSGWQVDAPIGTPDALVALPYAVIAQELALRMSLARGHTPDNPFPNGELNRVVRGVRVYPIGDNRGS